MCFRKITQKFEIYPSKEIITVVKETISASLVSSIHGLLERIHFVQEDMHQKKMSKNLLYEDMIAPIDSKLIKEAENLFNERILAIYGKNQSVSQNIAKANSL